MNSIDPVILADQAWRFLWEHANVLVLRLDHDGTVLAANAHSQSLTGLALVGQPVTALLVNFSGESPWTAWRTEPDRLHLANIHTASGIPQTYYVRIIPVADEFLIFAQADAVEQQRLQRDVMELNHEMSTLGRELALKNAELARLNALKNQFLGMATHDLRKPVGLILNYAEFLWEDAGSGLSPEQQHHLRTILTAAEGMRRVIEEFLDVSLIESGRLSLDLQPADLGDVVRTVTELVNPLAGKRKIRVLADLDSSVNQLVVDGSKLEQVLTNLLSNAVEHSPGGGGVRITSRKLPDGVEVRVIDTGAGISPEQRQHLFEAFAVGHKPKRSGERSIGLGLVIAHKIIEAHGGRMVVESEPGQGAVFGFTLPVKCLKSGSQQRGVS